MMKPQDIRIGDYLLADGKVIQVAAIHQKKVGYHNQPNKLTWVRLDRLDYIKITPETLMAFGFVKTVRNNWLFNDAFELPLGKFPRKKGCQSDLSWTVHKHDDEGFYRVFAHGYKGNIIIQTHQTISEMQHTFYNFTHGQVMPIKYHDNDLKQKD